MKKHAKSLIRLKMPSRQSMESTFGSIICIIFVTMIFLGITHVVQMAGSLHTKLYSQNLNPQEMVNRYQFKFTKLEDGTLAKVDTFYVNLQTLNFSWIMRKGLTPFDEQKDPTFLPNIIQTDSLVIENNLVQYGSNDTSVVYVSSKPAFLSVGDWQVQVKASRINKYGKEIWSKYSDAVPFFISDEESDDLPFDVPIFFNLRFN